MIDLCNVWNIYIERKEAYILTFWNSLYNIKILSLQDEEILAEEVNEYPSL